jgi:hypothetical protein
VKWWTENGARGEDESMNHESRRAYSGSTGTELEGDVIDVIGRRQSKVGKEFIRFFSFFHQLGTRRGGGKEKKMK